MLKAKPLSNLLAQSLDQDTNYAILFTKTGSLLAQASEPNNQRQSRVIAALAASIWSSSSSSPSSLSDSSSSSSSSPSRPAAAGQELAQALRGEDYMTIQLPNGKIFLLDVPVSLRAGLGVAGLEAGVLLGLQGSNEAQYGHMRLQAIKMKRHLEAEMADINS